MSSSSVEYSIAPSLSRDPFRDRQPPYSEDAEQAVLSAMLMDQDAIVRAVETVDDSMFYAERHRKLYRAMVSITERGSVVDPLTLSDELSRRGELDGASLIRPACRGIWPWGGRTVSPGGVRRSIF